MTSVLKYLKGFKGNGGDNLLPLLKTAGHQAVGLKFSKANFTFKS